MSDGSNRIAEGLDEYTAGFARRKVVLRIPHTHTKPSVVFIHGLWADGGNVTFDRVEAVLAGKMIPPDEQRAMSKRAGVRLATRPLDLPSGEP